MLPACPRASSQCGSRHQQQPWCQHQPSNSSSSSTCSRQHSTVAHFRLPTRARSTCFGWQYQPAHPTAYVATGRCITSFTSTLLSHTCTQPARPTVPYLQLQHDEWLALLHCCVCCLKSCCCGGTLVSCSGSLHSTQQHNGTTCQHNKQSSGLQRSIEQHAACQHYGYLALHQIWRRQPDKVACGPQCCA